MVGDEVIEEISADLHPGSVAILASVPGGAKTSFALNLVYAFSVAQAQASVVVSSELPILAVLRRVRSIYEDYAGTADPARTAPLQLLLRVHRQQGMSLGALSGMLERCSDDSSPPRLIVVDYAGLVKAASGPETITADLSQAVSELKPIAQRFGAAVVVLAQLPFRFRDASVLEAYEWLSEKTHGRANVTMLLQQQPVAPGEQNTGVPVELFVVHQTEPEGSTWPLVFYPATGRFAGFGAGDHQEREGMVR